MYKASAALLALCIVLAFPGAVWALDSADVPVTAEIPQMIILELDATELVFEESDFDYVLGPAQLVKVGVVATKEHAVTATVSGNVPYTLSIAAMEEFLTGTHGGLIHISQLKWRLTDSDNPEQWEPLTLERVSVKSGPPGTMEVRFDFQLTAFWENRAQMYTGSILLTVIPEESDESSGGRKW